MALSLKQIRYFVATAETGQISHAAVQLTISQSAVTTAIKDLERTVGAELFERHPHGMELTSSGREFLSHAYGILDKVREATQLNLAENDLKAKLTVAATYTVIGYFLPYHIERLQRLLPRLEIQLFELNRESIEEGLLANRYDIAVLLTSNILNPALSTETLISSARRLWVPAQHPMLQREVIGLKDVAEEPYIMLTIDEAAHSSLKYWVGDHLSAESAAAHLIDRSGAFPGRQRAGRRDPVRHGASPVVAGGQTDRNHQRPGPDSADGRRPGVAQGRGVQPGDGSLPLVFSPVL